MAESLRRRWRQAMERPFPRLVCHFATRLLRGGQRSAAAEFELGIAGILGLLAAPGGLFSILLFDKYGSIFRIMRGASHFDAYKASLTDKYFFIAYSMVITGIVTVLKWDKILPDRQDYTNLAHLPVRTRTIFMASAIAILFLAVVFVVDVNAASMVLFPVIATLEEPSFFAILRFAGTHALCVLLASAFVFCAIFSVMGVLMTALPRRLFRPISLSVRGAIILALVALLITGFAASSYVGRFHQNPHSWVRFMPPIWFVGLDEVLHGRASHEVAVVGKVSIWGTLGALVLAVLAYASSYRRSFLRVSEAPVAGHGRRPWGAHLGLLRVLLPASRFQRGCYPFALRVLLRSDIHSLLLALMAGLGLVLASGEVLAMAGSGARLAGTLPDAAVLFMPFIVAYPLICGVRFAFEIPAELNANWVFRTILSPEEHQAKELAKKVAVTVLAVFVLAPCFTLYSAYWGVKVGALHTAYVLGVSLCLLQVLLMRFRKVPFACSAHAGFRQNLLVLVVVYIGGYIAFTGIPAFIERWMFRDPWRFLLLPAAMLAGWLWEKQHLREDTKLDNRLVYEEIPAPAVQRLNLLDWN